MEIQGGRTAIDRILTIIQHYAPPHFGCSLHTNRTDTCEQNDTSHMPTHARHLQMLCNTRDLWCTQHCHMNIFPCGSPVGTERQNSLKTGELAELSLLSMALSTILKPTPQGAHPDCRVTKDWGTLLDNIGLYRGIEIPHAHASQC